MLAKVIASLNLFGLGMWLLLFAGCSGGDEETPCAVVDCGVSCEFLLRVVDEEGQALVSDEGPLFPDSLVLESATTRVFGQFVQGDTLLVASGFLAGSNSIEVLFRWNSEDTDTIKLDIEGIQGRCCNHCVYNQMLFNGVAVGPPDPESS